jgi:hypothetical protein
MSGSSSSSPLHGAQVSSSRRPREAGRDKVVGSSSRPAGPPCPSGPSVDPLPYGAQRDGHSRAAKICAPPDRSLQEVGGAFGACPPALRRFRLLELRLPAEAPVAGEVVRFDIDAKRDASGGTERCPAASAVVAHPGWQGPGCSCAPYCRQGPWSNPDRSGGRRDSPRANGGGCCCRRGS